MSKKTKTELLRDLLSREEGASLEEICAAMAWQPHSARAVISGLRKAGAEVALYVGVDGTPRRYRLKPDGQPEWSASGSAVGKARATVSKQAIARSVEDQTTSPTPARRRGRKTARAEGAAAAENSGPAPAAPEATASGPAMVIAPAAVLPPPAPAPSHADPETA